MLCIGSWVQIPHRDATVIIKRSLYATGFELWNREGGSSDEIVILSEFKSGYIYVMCDFIIFSHIIWNWVLRSRKLAVINFYNVYYFR